MDHRMDRQLLQVLLPRDNCSHTDTNMSLLLDSPPLVSVDDVGNFSAGIPLDTGKS
jgi:hypothetical protein